MQRASIAALLSLALAGTAVAQTQQQTPQDGAKPDPKNCASSSSGNLSNQLSQSGGVICPPDVDQGMKAPTPNTGNMPVIPPPGSPGGNPNVRPK